MIEPVKRPSDSLTHDGIGVGHSDDEPGADGIAALAQRPRGGPSGIAVGVGECVEECGNGFGVAHSAKGFGGSAADIAVGICEDALQSGDDLDADRLGFHDAACAPQCFGGSTADEAVAVAQCIAQGGYSTGMPDTTKRPRADLTLATTGTAQRFEQARDGSGGGITILFANFAESPCRITPHTRITRVKSIKKIFEGSGIAKQAKTTGGI
jgi:hypothetical protein